MTGRQTVREVRTFAEVYEIEKEKVRGKKGEERAQRDKS